MKEKTAVPAFPVIQNAFSTFKLLSTILILRLNFSMLSYSVLFESLNGAIAFTANG